MTAAIEARALTKTYALGFAWQKKVRALHSLDLRVEPGQVYGLLGPNGAGKSTTIKLLLNLIRPSSGDALVFGAKPDSHEARRSLGFLPENPAPYEYLTGREFVSLSGALGGLTGTALDRRVGEVLERVGMSQAAELRIRRYSKGMIQRVSLAQALVTKPRLLVLDEPTSGLDVLGRQLIRDLIIEQRKEGTTVLFCSHIIPDVEALCDRVAVLIGGKLVREGSVSELLAGEGSDHEVTVENLSAAGLEAVTPKVLSTTTLGDRVVLRYEERRSSEVLRTLLDANARITGLQRTRYSLEELFLEALKKSGRTVGSDVS